MTRPKIEFKVITGDLFSSWHQKTRLKHVKSHTFLTISEELQITRLSLFTSADMYFFCSQLSIRPDFSYNLALKITDPFRVLS